MQLHQGLRFWAALGLSAACLVGCGRTTPLQGSAAKASVAQAKSNEGVAQAIRAAVKVGWRKLDKDGSGFIEMQELNSRKDFESLDPNQDGKVSFSEAISILTSREVINSHKSQIKICFKEADNNSNNSIELNELEEFFFMKSANTETLKEQMNTYDLNQDGKLNFSEAEDAASFINMMGLYANQLEVFIHKAVEWRSGR